MRSGTNAHVFREVSFHADLNPATNVVSAESLEVLAPEADFRKSDEEFGIRMKTAYRVDLHAALVDLATRGDDAGAPVRIVTKAGIESFDGDNGTVVFESGEVATADLVVAADGVKSIAAAHINGAQCPPLESSDTIVFRFTLPKEDILSDPLAKQLLDAGPGMCTFNVGSDGNSWLVRYWCGFPSSTES